MSSALASDGGLAAACRGRRSAPPRKVEALVGVRVALSEAARWSKFVGEIEKVESSPPEGLGAQRADAATRSAGRGGGNWRASLS